MLSKMLLITLIAVPALAVAGQSGYVRHGQTFIVYKDGIKVGDWPKDEGLKKTASKAPSDAREPASSAITNDTLYFIDDAIGGGKTTRCYAISNAIGYAKSEPIACVRTDN